MQSNPDQCRAETTTWQMHRKYFLSAAGGSKLIHFFFFFFLLNQEGFKWFLYFLLLRLSWLGSFAKCKFERLIWGEIPSRMHYLRGQYQGALWNVAVCYKVCFSFSVEENETGKPNGGLLATETCMYVCVFFFFFSTRHNMRK